MFVCAYVDRTILFKKSHTIAKKSVVGLQTIDEELDFSGRLAKRYYGRIKKDGV